MQCPTCQKDLVEVPTVEGPQIDVCPGRHGLWLDKGEANLFVENYRVLQGTLQTVAAANVAGPTTSCPKCGRLLDQASLFAAVLFACRACHGWWLPQGSLTQLNETVRGGGAEIRVDERDFYRRAVKRSLPPQQSEDLRHGRLQHGLRTQQVWFWTIFLTTALLVAGLLLVAGIKKAFAPGHLAPPLDTESLFLAVGAFAGMGLSAYGFMVNNRKRLIESIPTSPIRSLAVGFAEVSGRAQPERALLRAPFSGMPCVLFSYMVEARRTSGEKSTWKTIAKGRSQEPFYVQDKTDRVLVVPFDAELILPDTTTTRSNWSGALPEEAFRGLLKLGVAVDGWSGEKTIRCNETFLLPDQQVYVMGTAQEHKGEIDNAENAARLYIGSSKESPFLISDRSEKELLSGLQWQVWASICGGPALALLCLLLLFKFYGTVH